MLAKKFRLTGVQNFARIQKEGKVYQSPNFGVAFINRGDQDLSHFGFIVSTKIAKDAVDRNRFKRAMSEAVRIASVDLVRGFDVVFLAKTSIVRVPTSEIMKEVRFSLKECGLSHFAEHRERQLADLSEGFRFGGIPLPTNLGRRHPDCKVEGASSNK